MSGWVFLGAGALVSIVDFLVGVRFTRMTPEQLERNPDGSLRSAEPIHRLGRVLMIVSPLFVILFACIAFGLFGPDTGIETISFNQG